MPKLPMSIQCFLCGSTRSPAEWTGVAVTDREMLRGLARLSETLTSCGTAEQHAKVEVWGFASSSEIKGVSLCQGAQSSNEANTMIAEQRARNVAAIIQGKVTPNVEVTAHPWNGAFDLMDKRWPTNPPPGRACGRDAVQCTRGI
jgi:hypothetical protein